VKARNEQKANHESLQVFSSNFCAKNGSAKTKHRLYLHVVQLKAVFALEESRAITSTFIRIGRQRKSDIEFSLCTYVNIRGIIPLYFVKCTVFS